jgi:nitrate/TMAO reductase-like tetraheme cytochrome c subunit
MNLLHLIEMFLVVGGVAYLMMLAGMTKSALEPKRARRFCPSCGRMTADCRCRR